MTKKLPIFVALVAFLAVVGLPVWLSLGATTDRHRPELELPKGETQCIEDGAYMIAHHMTMLNDWRNAVVRDGEKDYTSTSGKTYRMSLTGTCIACHERREAFCDRCHNYASVDVFCWDCHLDSKED